MKQLKKYHKRVDDEILEFSSNSAIQEGSFPPKQHENSANTLEVPCGVAFDNLDDTHEISHDSTSEEEQDIAILLRRSKRCTNAPDRLIQYL